MARALDRDVGDVVFLGPVFAWNSFYGKVRNRVARLWGGRYSFLHRSALAREYAGIWPRRIEGQGLDLIVAPAGSSEIAFLETDLPVVYTSDATFDVLVGYHPEFTGIGDRLEAQAHEIERRALQRASLALYPTQWAAASALRTYGADPGKVHVVPYGANMETVPDRPSLAACKRRDRCTLLFIGSPWERKGGPIACQVLAELRKAGVPAELMVVGSQAPSREYAELPGVTFLGRLDKGDVAQQRRLADLLAAATFLILPTLNESYGIVFCEASACGTPSLAPRTGGVPGVVTEGRNGFLLPPDGGPGPYVARIRATLDDWPGYLQLVASSRDEYERRLNWGAWSTRVNELLASVL
jgi:glycosyltransferase involved in cell wall biosynthesis